VRLDHLLSRECAPFVSRLAGSGGHFQVNRYASPSGELLP
jgi:hypothetical protein